MKKISILIILMFVCGTSLFSKEANDLSPYLEFSPKSTMRTNLNLALQQTTIQDSGKSELSLHPDYILPKKALLFSAIIPGAGELYCKSYLQSAIFFGIEIGAWTMYAIYHKKGQQKEDDFENYADTFWDEDKWQSWYDTYLTEEDKKVFSHTLPDTKTQQYYEMIGKYNEFIVGWEEVPDNLSYSEIQDYYSFQQEDYMDMRYDSNTMFKRANYGVYLALFNHLLSAIDAAWVAKKHNKRVIKTSLRFENKYFGNEDHTMLTLKMNW